MEHRLEDVLYRDVDRIVLMDQGQIVADLKPDELLSSLGFKLASVDKMDKVDGKFPSFFVKLLPFSLVYQDGSDFANSG